MITVSLSTYDRREPFEATLWDLGKQDLSGLPEVELIVVLNNSPAASHEIVDRVLPQLPYIGRKIVEPTPGLNYARNRIVKEARGDVVVYTDDDLFRDPNWLREMVKAFENPEVDCAGGRVLPRFTCPIPYWFKYPCYDGAIVKYDLGDRPFFLSDKDQMPFGASMAFRPKVFQKVGPFRTDITLRPGTFISGDETEYLLRVRRAGIPIFYQPTAICYHPIGEERLNKTYIRERFRGLGKVWARMNFEGERSFPRVAGAPRHLYRSMLEESLRWVGAAVRFDRAACFLHANELAFYRETASEFRRLKAERDKP